MQVKPIERKFGFPIRVCVALILVGWFMKIMSVPHAHLVLNLALVSISLFYFGRYIGKGKGKRPVDHVKLVFVITWSVQQILVVNHLKYKIVFTVFLTLGFVIWYFMEGLDYFSDEAAKGKGSRSTSLARYLFPAAAGFVLVGVLFRIQHWPWGIQISGLGVLLIVLVILFGLKKGIG